MLSYGITQELVGGGSVINGDNLYSSIIMRKTRTTYGKYLNTKQLIYYLVLTGIPGLYSILFGAGSL